MLQYCKIATLRAVALEFCRQHLPNMADSSATVSCAEKRKQLQVLDRLFFLLEQRIINVPENVSKLLNMVLLGRIAEEEVSLL